MRTRTSFSGRRTLLVGDGGLEQLGIVARLDRQAARFGDLVEGLGQFLGDAAEREQRLGVTLGDGG